MRKSLRFMLLQMRNPGDPMSRHEVLCFAEHLQCDASQIVVADLLSDEPTRAHLDEVDVVLLGGSGDHSVAQGGPWMGHALDVMRQLHDESKPTFASCWGFQAMARAMGGVVVTDMTRAEVGTHELTVTAAGAADPLFGPIGPTFNGQLGHADIVDALPDDAVLLASSRRVTNQAFRFRDKPIYCTQFHPELSLNRLLDRLRSYPSYVEHIVGLPYDEFVKTCKETPETGGLLQRFVDLVVLEGVG